jgi:hypothetical protein
VLLDDILMAHHRRHQAIPSPHYCLCSLWRLDRGNGVPASSSWPSSVSFFPGYIRLMRGPGPLPQGKRLCAGRAGHGREVVLDSLLRQASCPMPRPQLIVDHGP